MITKHVETGLISIFANGSIQVRDDHVIVEDGIEISRTYVLSVLNPSADTDNIANSNVKLIAQLVWTPEIIAAFQQKLASLG